MPDAERIAKKLGDTYRYYQYSTNRLHGREQANALVWREDLFDESSVATVVLPTLSQGRASFFERLLYGRYREQHRNAIILKGTLKEGIAVQIATPHPDIHGLDGHHASQIGKVCSSLVETDCDQHLLLGDLNLFGSQLLWPKVHKVFDRYGFVDVSKDTGGTFLTVPGQRLDRVLFRGRGRVDVRREKVKGSDHYPLVASVELRAA